MPEQQRNSSFAKNLGVRVAQANAEHMNRPINTGKRNLPAGVKDGICKLSAMYTKEYEDDKNGPGTKGQTFFRASAVALYPEDHNGERVKDLVTSVVIPLCDMPAKGMRKAVSFSENWFEFQNLFRLLGVAPCPETPQTDPTGQRTEAYFMAAMKMLTDPVRQRTNPVYISFTTRGWKAPKTPAETQEAWDKKDPMVFETWHGLATPEEVAKIGTIDPAAGITETQPQQPPSAPPSAPPTQQPHRDLALDIADTVAAMVETAMADKDGNTEEGASAIEQLIAAAMTNGWTKEETDKAADWAAVGDMALNPPDRKPPTTTTQGTVPLPQPSSNGDPKPGSVWMFQKRSKDGSKLVNAKKEEFPAQEVEVVTCDPATKTCTLKNRKDGKDVMDIRTKKPAEVKWEWLEEAKNPPY